MKTRRLPGLNLLRVFAALYMVMYHVHPPFLPTPLQNFFSDGASDTSLFFVLSGFLLAHLYADNVMDDAGQRAFVWRRMARIYPANLVGLLFLVLAQAAFGNSVNSWSVLVQCVLLLQAWTVGSAYALNVPAWSMSCVLFFYLLFPVVLPVLKRLHTAALQVSLVLLWVCSAFLLPMLSTWPGAFRTESWEQYLHNSPLPRSFEFVLGMGVALLVSSMGRPSVWWFRLAVPTVFCTMLTGSAETVRIDNGLLAPISVLLVVAFTNPGSLAERLGRSRAMGILSSASICMFLVHMTWAQIFTAWVFPHWHTEWNIWTLGLYLATVIGFSVALDRWVCRPVSHLLTGSRTRRSASDTTQPAFSINQPNGTVTDTQGDLRRRGPAFRGWTFWTGTFAGRPARSRR